jgi:cell division protein ZapD
VANSITYELPLNERIRTFLRLEKLFKQVVHFSQHDNEWQARAELGCLLDIFTLSSRADLKSEITKEIEHHTKSLAFYSNSPNVDSEKLRSSIEKLNELNLALHATPGRIDQKANQIDLLKCLNQRSSIPGGTCDFDLPGFHYWLNKPLQERREEIQYWSENLIPIQKSVKLLLEYIRSSGMPTPKVAACGVYQQSLGDQQAVQLIRVSLDQQSPYFSEISGGKHRFTVRFMSLRETDRPAQTSDDINFNLILCHL